MSPEQAIGAIAGIAALCGLLVGIGKWAAKREQGEQIAKDQTRTAINRIEPKLDELLVETREQSRTLAVLNHQANAHDKRLGTIETRIDEHGNRITRLEERKSQP